MSVLTIVNLLLLIVEFFCLWCGLRAVQQKVNLPPRAGGAVALIIWYAFMYILAVIQYSGLVIAGAMVIGCLLYTSAERRGKRRDSFDIRYDC